MGLSEAVEALEPTERNRDRLPEGSTKNKEVHVNSMKPKTIAMIGLDTSHTVAFTKLIQKPGESIVDGMRVVKAFRFPSAFQSEEGQDARQAELESLGVTLAETLDEAVAGVDALFLEINDPALHLEYFEKVASCGKPVFIDKPLAASVAEGRRIQELARHHNLPVWSSSSLRFIPALTRAQAAIPRPERVHTFGPLGKAAAGSDLVWYGVHAVEMLVTAMGPGAAAVRAIEEPGGILLRVGYGDGRSGLVECLRGFGAYGGRLQTKKQVLFFDSGSGSPYEALMGALRAFVLDGKAPVPLAEALEVMTILEAGGKSLKEGREIEL